MAIHRITLENYMSHAHTVIEPADGLTVLVGPNNCGKSAVVSALQTLCYNARGDYMVRHLSDADFLVADDKRQTRVTVETDDGDSNRHAIAWIRRDTTVSYTIDGERIDRLGGVVPDGLHGILKLPKVDVGEHGEPFDIHFGLQKSPIFLLDEPESRAALFFASSSDAAMLLKIQKRHRDKVRERTGTKTRLKGEIARLDSELNIFEPLKTLCIALSEVEQKHQQITDLQSQSHRLEEDIAFLDSHSLKHTWHARRQNILAPLEFVPDLADTSFVEALIAQLISAERDFQKKTTRSCALGKLASPPDLEDVISLQHTFQDLAVAESRRLFWSVSSATVQLLSMPPENDLVTLHDQIQGLTGVIQSLIDHSSKHDWLDRKNKLFAHLSVVPVMADDSTVKSLIRNVTDEERSFQEKMARSCALGRLRTPPALEDVASLEYTVQSLVYACHRFLQMSALGTATKDLRATPALDNVQQRQSLMLALSREIETNCLLVEKVNCLGQLKEVPSSTNISPFSEILTNLADAQRANSGLNAPARILGRLATPPKPTDCEPLERLIKELEGALASVNFFREVTGFRKESVPPARTKKRFRTIAAVVTGGFVALVVLIWLIVLAPSWLSRTSVELSRTDVNETSQAKTTALSEQLGKKEIARTNDGAKQEASQAKTKAPSEQLVTKETVRTSDGTKQEEPLPKAAPQLPGKTLPRNQPEKDQPKQAEVNPERDRRLKLVRQLLDDGALATQKGKNLDAVLAFGQAAVLYPQELAEVDQPANIRRRFLEALQAYQAEVEAALAKAGERQSPEK